MYHFKNMIQTARTHGVQVDGGTFTSRIGLSSNQITKLFWDSLEECQHFIFRPHNKGEPKDVVEENVKELYAPPFAIFSLEMTGLKNHLTSSRDGSEAEFSISSMMAVEVKPRNFIVFTCALHEATNQHRVIATDHCLDVVNSFVERINHLETGTQKIKERIKIGSGSDKRQIEVRRITYVSHKKYQNEIETQYGGKVDWSHRWFVRGHWVKLDPNSIGKDRSGDYCVPGQTWRREHIKGADDMPLVTKTRLVKG